MKLKEIGSKIVGFINWVGKLGVNKTDDVELKSHKIILTISQIVTVLNLAFFSFEYFKMDRLTAAYTLLICGIIHTISLILFRFHRNFLILRDTYFIVMYIYVIFYQTSMGGYIGSVEYIMYGIPLLVGTQMFYKDKNIKMYWFLSYIIMAIVLYLLEPIISKNHSPLPDNIILFTKLNNFVLIAALVVLSINYFLGVIRAEKQKSDALIRNILPSTVVDELNSLGISHPVLIPKATVIFMDFVGFTAITQKMTPLELVAILNEHFVNFDTIFKKHNIEKLKTIGDGYMAVGGLPEINHSHPLDVALAGLKILNYMDNKVKDLDWNIRIGIHTGPMVAGIIGETKFSYDVWGHTVNLCSRLETAGKQGEINVSEDFYEYTKNFFEFEQRGYIDIKNSDPVKMYLLKDLKPHLKTKKFHPNSKFYEDFKIYSTTPLKE
jgi:adenylate cyclase